MPYAWPIIDVPVKKGHLNFIKFFKDYILVGVDGETHVFSVSQDPDEYIEDVNIESLKTIAHDAYERTALLHLFSEDQQDFIITHVDQQREILRRQKERDRQRLEEVNKRIEYEQYLKLKAIYEGTSD